MLSLVYLTSCEEEEPVSLIPDIYTGKSSALKNGEDWNALSRTQLSVDTSRFSIVFDTYSDEGFWRESLGIGGILPIIGKQEFDLYDGNDSSITSSSYGTWIDDGDVGGDYYILDTTSLLNFVEIIKYNSQKSEIEGIFHSSLILENEGNQTPGEAPEKLVFSEGLFKVKVEREWFE